MNERVQLSERILSESENRLDDLRSALESEPNLKLGELRRYARLFATSQRNIDWIIEAPDWFEIPSSHTDLACELKPLIKNLLKDAYERISDREGQGSKTKKKVNKEFERTIKPEGNGVLTLSEVNRIDEFIRLLEEAPRINDVDLWERTKQQRLTEIDKAISEGLSYGEARNAPPILNQTEEKFRADLKEINNNIVEQIKIIEHCLPRWFSMGEFPPPYYASRIVVILRKAKEYGRESKFLRAYLTHFRSSLGESRTVELLIQRAEVLGIELPPVS